MCLQANTSDLISKKLSTTPILFKTDYATSILCFTEIRTARIRFFLIFILSDYENKIGM